MEEPSPLPITEPPPLELLLPDDLLDEPELLDLFEDELLLPELLFPELPEPELLELEPPELLLLLELLED